MDTQSISTICNDPGLLNILKIVKRILDFIQLVGPLLSIIGLVVLFVNMINNPDEKKNFNKIRNLFIALVLTFFIPIIVDVAIRLVDEESTLSACWSNVVDNIEDADYILPYDDDDLKSPIIDSSLYDPGESGESENTNNTNNTNNTSSNDSQNNEKVEKIVYIGDSRTVQMYAYSNNDWGNVNYSEGGIHEVGKEIYVAEVSMGLKWLKNTGVPAAEKYFKSGTAVVILMGVNDLYNADGYITYINNNISNWTKNGSKVYFVSVNPCDGKYQSNNSKIEEFNKKVKKGISSKVGWIDTYSYLKSKGFKTTDGIHYDASTSKKINNYIKSKM